MGRFFAGLAVLLWLGWPAAGAAAQPSWYSQEEMLLFYEALGFIRAEYLSPQSPRETVRAAIKSYVSQLDPFSTYLSAAEFHAFNDSQRPHYGGVGMDVWQRRDGRIVCLPYPDSPALEAGIEQGDELLAVEGLPVRGRSLYMVGAEIRGQAGTRVNLTVRGEGEPVRGVSVRRRRTESISVSRRTEPRAEVLTIHGFSASTPERLRGLAARLDPDLPLVVDLRGNVGGDLHAGIEAAKLFLRPGQVVATLRGRGEPETFTAGEESLFSENVILLQDELTASSAELFIAALTRNGRAVSLGSRSFGKGQTQKFHRLSDGSALLLTWAEIIPPDGRAFHSLGLEPMAALDEDLLTAAMAGEALDSILTVAQALRPAALEPAPTLRDDQIDLGDRDEQ